MVRPAVTMFGRRRARLDGGAGRCRIQVVSTEEEERLSKLPQLHSNKDDTSFKAVQTTRNMASNDEPTDQNDPAKQKQTSSSSSSTSASSEQHECAICVSPTLPLPTLVPGHEVDLNPGEEYQAQLPCGHIFGHSCILLWLIQNSELNHDLPDQRRCPTCPICRFNLVHSECGHIVLPAFPQAAPPTLPNILQPGEYIVKNGVITREWIEKRAPLAGKCLSCRWMERTLAHTDEITLAARFNEIQDMLIPMRDAIRALHGLPLDYNRRTFLEQKSQFCNDLITRTWPLLQINNGRVLRRHEW